mgnify:CR=1 FL=1
MDFKLFTQNFLTYMGLDVKSYNLKNSFNFRLKHFLDLKQIDCVLDVGANSGQFALNLRRIGYKEQIMSFEPITSAYDELKKNSKKVKNWEVFNFALGDIEEETEINISQNSLSSSIMNMEKEHLTSEPKSKYIRREKIAIKTIDNLDNEILKKFKNIYLKIDTQGYEEKVLNGATNLIRLIKGLQLEMSIYPMYEGQLLFNKFYEKIENLDFELWDIERAFSNPESGKILQIDAIFFKKS